MIVSQHSMTIEQILNEALEREREAQAFYSRLAAGCSVACLRELLDKLKDEESKHISLIRKMQLRLEAGHDVMT